MSPSEDIKTKAQDLVAETERYVRVNPVAAVVGAVAFGFAVGLIFRALEPRRRPQPIHDALDEVRDLLAPLAAKTRRGVADSSAAVREAVEEAVDRAQDLDLDPVTSWWKKLWS